MSAESEMAEALRAMLLIVDNCPGVSINTQHYQRTLDRYDAGKAVREAESAELDTLRDLEYSVRHCGDTDSILAALAAQRKKKRKA